ncbi:hypothetical protein PCASD_01074 [Puccinia coronata f. sp. avenae]|uniref:Uncharacterized protein n=1 Tax=Puccinia coronata f. sp. avenae TaxID=200324 RepID=A0A2N5VMN4_9BASI|nr:hypothetical protein PCASD_01074 [Puccinia coronata f. sp. avenae]
MASATHGDAFIHGKSMRKKQFKNRVSQHFSLRTGPGVFLLGIPCRKLELSNIGGQCIFGSSAETRVLQSADHGPCLSSLAAICEHNQQESAASDNLGNELLAHSGGCPLLIRHRYQNPFPPPPFRPSSCNISTDPSRYAGYRFLRNLENEREVTVVSEADLGMPIELGIEADGTYGLARIGRETGSHLRQSISRQGPLDPEDLALLVEPPAGTWLLDLHYERHLSNQTLTVQGTSHPSTSGSGSQAPSSVHIPEKRKTEVSWLRRTEYFNDVQHKSRDSIKPDGSTDQSSSMSNLPDDRLEHAILRPVPGDVGGPRLAYFLPESSEGVKNYQQIKEEKKTIDEEDQLEEAMEEDQEADPEPVNQLHFVRDYEISQQRPIHQYLLIFDDGQASGRRKAAYFNPVGHFRTLRKRRPKPQEPAHVDGKGDPLWDGISVSLTNDPKVIARSSLSATSSWPPY